MLRVIGWFLNPFASLFLAIFGWIGRGIDRLLGPRFGWALALGLFALACLGLGSSIWDMSPQIGRALGVTPPEKIQVLNATVVNVERLGGMFYKVTARIEADQTLLSGTMIKSTALALRKGDPVAVYVNESGRASFVNSTNGAIEIFFLVIVLLVLTLLVFFTLKFFRHRRTILQKFLKDRAASQPQPADPSPTPPFVREPNVSPVARRGERILSTAERLQQGK